MFSTPPSTKASDLELVVESVELFLESIDFGFPLRDTPGDFSLRHAGVNGAN